jgi:adenylate cyclase
MIAPSERILPELVAIGRADQQWKQPLRESQVVRLGRAPRSGWGIPWDMHISREHADIQFAGGRLTVRVLDSARNPAIVNGKPATEFQIGPGQSFTIGETVFTLSSIDLTDDAPSDVIEYSYSASALEKIDFGNGEKRLEALTHLPRLIADTASDAEFATKVVQLLLRWLPKADAAAVVQYDLKSDAGLEKPNFMRWDSRNEVGRFRPSRRLMRAAVESGESKLHSWIEGGDKNAAFTQSGNLDWAFCTPVGREAASGWCLYVSGRGGCYINELAGDVKFTELLAQFLAAIRRVRLLEHKQTTMSQFFSPAVMETLADEEFARVLEPRENIVTVLFCDVRGFSKKVEEAGGNLHGILKQMSAALGVMTQNILRHEGVIADFQGDAALGFWGWPAQPPDGPTPACLAALNIAEQFLAAEGQANHPLCGVSVGLGVGHGRAIAGQIGTKEQIKVGVFGPVVNLASRLEGLTRQLGVSIVLDEATADYLRNHPQKAARVRRLARVRPKGMQSPVTVSELLPPVGGRGISEEQITAYEAALDAVIAGSWKKALPLLEPLADHDPPAAFLKRSMAETNFEPPTGWDGAFTLKSK